MRHHGCPCGGTYSNTHGAVWVCDQCLTVTLSCPCHEKAQQQDPQEDPTPSQQSST